MSDTITKTAAEIRALLETTTKALAGIEKQLHILYEEVERLETMLDDLDRRAAGEDKPMIKSDDILIFSGIHMDM